MSTQKIMRAFIAGAGLLLLCSAATAAPSSTMQAVLETIKSTSSSANAELTTTAIRTLSAALLIQWVLTHWRELFSGELTSLLPKAIGAMMWGAVAFWAIGNQAILSGMFDGYLKLATGISGVNFNPSAIWSNGVNLQNNLVAGFNTSTGADSFLGAIQNFIPALWIMIACLVTLISYGFVAFTVFMAVSEFWLMFAVTPIAIAMLGIVAFRDQGMAPLKGVISLGLRIIILGLILKVLGNVQETATAAFAALPDEDPMETIWYTLGGVFACAVMALNAGKIASGIASGSSNFSGGDGVRGAMQVAAVAAPVAAPVAAIGAAAAGGLAAAAGGITTAAKGASGAVSAASNVASSMANRGGMTATNAAMSAKPIIGGPLPDNRAAARAREAAVDGDGAKNSVGAKAADGSGKNASIGGAEQGSGGSNSGGQGQGQMGKMGGALSRAGDALTQDNHAVGITMNTRGE